MLDVLSTGGMQKDELVHQGGTFKNYMPKILPNAVWIGDDALKIQYCGYVLSRMQAELRTSHSVSHGSVQ